MTANDFADLLNFFLIEFRTVLTKSCPLALFLALSGLDSRKSSSAIAVLIRHKASLSVIGEVDGWWEKNQWMESHRIGCLNLVFLESERLSSSMRANADLFELK